MSISLLLVSLNLNFVTKIKVARCFFFVVEEKAWAIRNSEASEQLAMLKKESRVL